MDPITGRRLVEPYPNGVYVVQNPPSAPLTTAEMDEVAGCPTRATGTPTTTGRRHPRLRRDPLLHLQQPRLLRRVLVLRAHLPPGPHAAGPQPREHHARGGSAHARSRVQGLYQRRRRAHGQASSSPRAQSSSRTACARTAAACGRASAATWTWTKTHTPTLLRDLRQLPGVKKVFVRSGIRLDYTMADASDKFLVELLQHHVSGQLRLAPEHVSDAVLSVMGKPRREVYDAFVERFERLSAEVRPQAVRGPLPHLEPSGLHHEGGRRAGLRGARHGLHARTGAGFLPPRRPRCRPVCSTPA